jgi:hypothetical protein
MKKQFFLTAILVTVLINLSITVKAQEENVNPLDTLTQTVIKLQDDVNLFKRIKISGYLQPQFQMTDSNGSANYSGGNFNANTDKRFMLRRARVKIAYETLLSQYVFQIDATEKGFAIKDMYAKFTEPWAKTVSLTVGCMNRPFGYEIGYSSSLRETPERARMSQIIFPGERDLGAMLTFQIPKTSKWNFIKAEAGLYNGTGAGAVDFDYQKDFIGRIRIDKSNKSEKISYGLGVSYYNGGNRQGRKNVYTNAADSSGLMAFVLNNDTTNYGKIAKRTYIGGDFQLNIELPIGMTTIRAEYIQGEQPGTSSTTATPTAQPTTDNYIRNFNGAYFYFLQNIWTTKFQFVAKYDWYDPNTEVAGDVIGQTVKSSADIKVTKTGKNDLKYTTFGLGIAYRWDNNIKITAYYDMVKNETSKNVTGYAKDLKDNVFTLRVQYKF